MVLSQGGYRLSDVAAEDDQLPDHTLICASETNLYIQKPMMLITPKSTRGIVIETLSVLSSPSPQTVPSRIPVKKSTNQIGSGIPSAKTRSRRSQPHTRSWLKMTKMNGMDKPADMLTIKNGQPALAGEVFSPTYTCT
jgi:hypothetical protein